MIYRVDGLRRGVLEGSFAPSVEPGLDFQGMKHLENAHCMEDNDKAVPGDPFKSELYRSPFVNWPAFPELLQDS